MKFHQPDFSSHHAEHPRTKHCVNLSQNQRNQTFENTHFFAQDSNAKDLWTYNFRVRQHTLYLKGPQSGKIEKSTEMSQGWLN